MERNSDENKYLIQLQHIIDIDTMLHKMQKPTLKELSAKIELDDRSTSRYLKMMKESFGAPIRSYRNGERYEYDYADPNYTFMDITISQNEANALIAARQLIQSIPLPGFYSKTLEGLNNLITRAERFNKIEGLELHDKIVFIGEVQSTGTAYPLALKDGFLYTCSHHMITKYTVQDKKLVAAETAEEIFDTDGNATYTYASDGKDAQTVDDNSNLTRLFEEYENAEPIIFSVEKQ